MVHLHEFLRRELAAGRTNARGQGA
jgi:hypothetical protein